MPSLDLRSLSFMSGIMSVILGLILLAVRAHFPASIRGLRLWGWAPLLCAFATALFVFSGVLPKVLLVLLGNGLVMAGVAFYLFGSQRFFLQPVAWRQCVALGGVALSLMALFWWVQPDYRVRTFIFTSTLALVCAAHVRLLLRWGTGGFARLATGVLAVQTLVLVVRGVSSLWLDAADTDRFAPSPIQTAYLASFCFTVLLLSVAVLLMASERMRSEFEHLATHDSLTGVLTRRVLLELADSEMQRWQRYGHTFSVLMLDVDHFKQINDTHGHLVGDAVLRDVAGHVRAALRASDRLGRYGGEEFLVLMPATDLPAAQAVAERVAAAVRNATAQAGGPHCTVSIGVTSVGAGDANFDVLLARADAALYRAKSGGRDRVVIAAAETENS